MSKQASAKRGSVAAFGTAYSDWFLAKRSAWGHVIARQHNSNVVVLAIDLPQAREIIKRVSGKSKRGNAAQAQTYLRLVQNE